MTWAQANQHRAAGRGQGRAGQGVSVIGSGMLPGLIRISERSRPEGKVLGLPGCDLGEV